MDHNTIHGIKLQLSTYIYPETKIPITIRTQQLRPKKNNTDKQNPEQHPRNTTHYCARSQIYLNTQM